MEGPREQVLSCSWVRRSNVAVGVGVAPGGRRWGSAVWGAHGTNVAVEMSRGAFEPTRPTQIEPARENRHENGPSGRQ